MAKIIKTISGMPITITPAMVEIGKNPGNWELKMIPMKQIERVEVGQTSLKSQQNQSTKSTTMFEGAELKIITRSGNESIDGSNITLEEAKEAYALIKKQISGDPTEDPIDDLQGRIDGLMDENIEINKKIDRLESLINDLLEKMSVNTPEGDLLG